MDDSYLVTGEMVPLNREAGAERYNESGCGVEAIFWDKKNVSG